MLRPITATSALVLAACGAHAQPTVLSRGGTDDEVFFMVNSFRAAIGGSNPNVSGSFLGGRREINRDGVPDSASAPNLFPGDFFNAPVSPRVRGSEFFTPGSGFMLSADDNNPT